MFAVLIEQREAKNILHIIISSDNKKPYYIESKGMTPQVCFQGIGRTFKQPVNRG